MVLWQSSVVIRTKCRTQALAWRKAPHTTGTHHLVQRQALASRKLCDDMGPNKGSCVTTWSWQGELCDIMGQNTGHWNDMGQNTGHWNDMGQNTGHWNDMGLNTGHWNDMGLNTGNLCDNIRLNKGHYWMTWDWAKETMEWYETEHRKPTWYAVKQGNYETMWGWERELCPVIGKNKGNSYITIKYTGSLLPQTSHYKSNPEQR
jgi:hypothetical protein